MGLVERLKKAAVIGSGIMGRGIALVAKTTPEGAPHMSSSRQTRSKHPSNRPDHKKHY